MKIAVVSILPELIEGGLSAGVVGRASRVVRLAPDATARALDAADCAGRASAAGSAGSAGSTDTVGSTDSAPPPDAALSIDAARSGEASGALADERSQAPSGPPLTVALVNPRDFTSDRHRTVDDTPYGGGPGMVMKPEPLLAAIATASRALGGAARRVLLTPVGRPLDQSTVRRLAAEPALVLVCGRYEGIDERVIEAGIDEEISIGDYVLSGGELGALVILDAVARLVPGVLGEPASASEESFSDALLEYPQYTRPWRLGERQVPDILASGNHAAIAAWRRARSLERTARRRPELYARHRPTPADRKLLRAMPQLEVAARTSLALVHHPVVDRSGAVVTSAVTNFDLHDLARSSRTYGLAGYFVVTPVTAQKDKVRHIARMWQEQEELDHRASALELVRPASSLEEVIASLGQAPGSVRVVATSANWRSFPDLPRLTSTELIGQARADDRPLLLVFGTGWGLAESVNPLIEQVLVPIEGAPSWNHLSVRSAVAIILDRLFGLREQGA